MRVVAWNCCDGFRQKYKALCLLKPDIAIVSEVRQSCLNQLGLESPPLWIGPPGQKGLAVLGFGNWRVQQMGDPLGNWFLPFEAVTARRRFTGVGVWTETGPTPYQQTAEAAVARMMPVEEGPMVVAGDFNLSDALATAPATNVVKSLKERGLESVWHSLNGEVGGAESVGTYFHYRRKRMPFHIDYVFVDRRLLPSVTSFAIEPFDAWVANGRSDHVPLVADIADDAMFTDGHDPRAD